MTDEVVTPDRCHSDSSLILEYQQLYNRYAFCLANLRESIKEVQALGQDNESLRLANADLVHRLSLLSRATIHNCLLSDFNRLRISGNATPSPRLYSREASPAPAPDVIQQKRFQRRHLAERVSLPKSISIRSAGYLKFKPESAGKYEAPTTQASSPNRVNSPPLPDSEKARQRVYVAGGGREEEASQFEVYNQGMSKTELCNKWQETGSCPFAGNCRFAHGIMELRPVIRHPRYKTEVCRMVLARDICPYGHRCHFRHSLS
ncbi:zinc finger CCCH domain-containing protein 15-like [Coffea arabica]|uniref:Zinc finger CCCH domain-containing protein 15-like n=1 Tax=Coffea arabica TaxID=13443 RepID=A0A6P6TKZ9_COFAR